MGDLSYIAPAEKPAMDPCRIEALFSEYGPTAGEDLVYRVMEELAKCLCQVQAAANAGPREHLYGMLGFLSERANFVGLSGLARIASDVQSCIEDADPVAEAATLARLARAGERSLSLLWDLQDVSV